MNRMPLLSPTKTAYLWVAIMGLVLGSLTACSEQPSYHRLVLIVDAEPDIRAQARTLEIKSPSITKSFDLTKQGFPDVFGRYYASPGETGTLEIRALAGKRLIAIRKVAVTFAPGRRALRVLLADGCELPRGACPETLTCNDCGECASPEIHGATLPQVTSETEALQLSPTQCGSDVSMDGGTETPDGDGGGLADSDGSLDDGDTGAPAADLTLTIAKDVASDSCVPLVVARVDAGPEAVASLSASAGTLHDDPSCLLPLTFAFPAGVAQRTVYYRAPASLGGAYTASSRIEASLDQSSAEANVALRLRATHLSRGSFFNCARVADGALFCAGSASFSRLGNSGERPQPVPERAASVDSIPSSAVLRSEGLASCTLASGKLSCFGEGTALGDVTNANSATPVVPQGMGSGVLSFDVGMHHMCAVKSDHTLWCWGKNYGRPCPGNEEEQLPAPVQVTDVPQPVECAAARGSTCARTETGDVYCRGNLGVPTSFTKVNLGGLPAKRIVAGYFGACAIVDANGEDQLRCWRDGVAPERVAGLPSGPIEHVTTLGRASCASVSGALYCWGNNLQGWLGIAGSEEVLTATRVTLPSGTLEEVVLGEVNGIAVSAIIDGLVYSWGLSSGGSLGVGGHGVQPRATRTPMLDGRNVSSLSIGFYAGCALDSGQAYCWGGGGEIGNGKNDLLNGAFTQVATPPISLPTDLTDVSVGTQFALATSGDEAFGWGLGGWGQLGNGTTDPFNAWAPIRASAVENLSGDIAQLATGEYKSCARTSTHAIYCWGGWGPYASVTYTTPQQVAAPDEGVSDVAIWEGGACLVRDGGVECWPNDNFVPVPRADFGTQVVDIDGTGRTMCARHETGEVTCSLFMDAATQVFASGVETMRAGSGFVCARLTNGELHCAGANDRGQLGRSDLSPGVKGPGAVDGLVPPIGIFDVGPFVSCAKDTEGFKCWGDNEHNVMSTVPWVFDTPQLMAPWR